LSHFLVVSSSSFPHVYVTFFIGVNYVIGPSILKIYSFVSPYEECIDTRSCKAYIKFLFKILVLHLITILILWWAVCYKNWFASLWRFHFLKGILYLQSFHPWKDSSCSVTLHAEDINLKNTRTLSSGKWRQVLGRILQKVLRKVS